MSAVRSWARRHFIAGGLNPYQWADRNGTPLVKVPAGGACPVVMSSLLGQAMRFDGDDVIALPRVPTIVPPLTLFMEFSVTSISGTQTLLCFGKPAGGGSMTGWKLGIDAFQLIVGCKPGSDWSTLVAPAANDRYVVGLRMFPTVANITAEVVLARGSSEGTNSDSGTLSIPTTPDDSLYIGAGPVPAGGYTDFLTGDISKFALYNNCMDSTVMKSLVYRARGAELAPWADLFPDFDFPFGKSAPQLEQEGFRGRNDNGSESGASWIAAQDTDFTITALQNFRTRFLLNSTGDRPSEQYQVEYEDSQGHWRRLS